MIKVETKQEVVEIPDLKLFVRQYEPIWITQEQYNSSIAIKKLEKMGSIVCHINQRSRKMAKLPKPGKTPIRTSKLSRPNKGGMGKPTPKKPKDDIQEVLRQATEQAANQAAEKAVQAVATQILASLPSQQQNPVEGLEEMVQRAVLNALGNLPLQNTGVTSPQTITGPEEPVYIPSNIVDKNAKGNVNIKSETSTSEGLDNAAEALKELRKSKQKSKTKRRK